MPQIPKRVVEIAQQLKQGEKPRRWKVKTMMKWFDAERRRDNVVSKIKRGSFLRWNNNRSGLCNHG